VKEIYFPDDPPIQVHQNRLQQCRELFPEGFYWYGSKLHGPDPTKESLEDIRANHWSLE